MVEDRSKTEIADLDLAKATVDEDVVTLYVPMYDGRISCVQIVETIENLQTPVLDHFQPYALRFFDESDSAEIYKIKLDS